MGFPIARVLRITLVSGASVSVLFARFAMGFFSENEATRVIHFAMFAVGGLLAFGAVAFKIAEALRRRDAVGFGGFRAECMAFALLRFLGLV